MSTLRCTIPLLLSAALPAQWLQVSPTLSPSARSGHAMAAAATGTVYLFGGLTGFQPNNQTWSYDGSSWTQLNPANAPTGRSGIELVYDSSRNRLVLFGGWATAISVGNALNDTWEFDPVNLDWAQVTPTTSPGGLWKYGACFDSARGRVVLYGGASNGFPIAVANTWEFDGTTWTQVAGASAPGPLERPALCFHGVLNRTLLFGGINPQSGGTDQTWSFDGTTWTQLPVTGPRPPVRTGARMVYDPLRGAAVLTGGMNPQNGTPFTDTWEFDGAAWTQINTSHAPGRDFGLAFDGVRRAVVRFGGIAGSATNADTFEYGARAREFGFGCPGSNGVPTLSTNGSPRLGTTWSLTLNNLTLSAPLAVVVLSLTELAPLPLASIGMPNCSAYVTPDLLVTVPAATSAAVWSGAIPNQPGLLGSQLLAQGLSLDPGVNAAGLTVSNAAAGTLGY